MNIPKDIRDIWRTEGDVENYILFHKFWVKKYNWVFYREPFALDKWKPWREYTKKNFPIQYFFREILNSEIRYYYKFCIKEKWYYLTCYFWHKHNVIKLNAPPTFLDSDSKIELALEKILFDFIEKEKPQENTVIEDHEEWWEAINSAYDYFKNIRPFLQKERSCLLDILYGNENFDDFIDNLKKDKTPEQLELKDRLDNLEKQIDIQDEKCYSDIVKYRKFMWT